MKRAKYRPAYEHMQALTLQLCEPWAGKGRVVIGDAGFGSLATLIALHSVLGLYCILLVKHAYKRFPRWFLKTWGDALPWSARGSHKLVQTDSFKSFPSGFAIGPLPDADVSFHAYGLG